MSKLILVTADRDRGKTTALWNLYKQFNIEKNKRIGGYITVLNKNDDKSRIVIKDLSSGEEMLLASSIEEDWAGQEERCFKMGMRYTFFQDVFDRSCDSYRNALDCSHIFIDEAGALELKDKGFSPAIEYLRKNYKGTLVIAVRELFLEDFQMIYSFDNGWTTQVLTI
jgi:nucleoside-triphosphatase THEP1